MTVRLSNIKFEDGMTLPCDLNLLIEDPAPGTINVKDDFDQYVSENAFAQLKYSFGMKAESFIIESIS